MRTRSLVSGCVAIMNAGFELMTGEDFGLIDSKPSEGLKGQ